MKYFLASLLYIASLAAAAPVHAERIVIFGATDQIVRPGMVNS